MQLAQRWRLIRNTETQMILLLWYYSVKAALIKLMWHSAMNATDWTLNQSLVTVIVFGIRLNPTGFHAIHQKQLKRVRKNDFIVACQRQIWNTWELMTFKTQSLLEIENSSEETWQFFHLFVFRCSFFGS